MNFFGDCLRASHAAHDWPGWEVIYRRAFPSFASMVDHRADGYWQRFRRRLPWVALTVLAVVLAAVEPWPGLHRSTLSGLHLSSHWDVIGMSYLWYVVVIGLLVALPEIVRIAA